MFIHILKCFSEKRPYATYTLPPAEMHLVPQIVDNNVTAGVDKVQAIYVIDEGDFEL